MKKLLLLFMFLLSSCDFEEDSSNLHYHKSLICYKHNNKPFTGTMIGYYLGEKSCEIKYKHGIPFGKWYDTEVATSGYYLDDNVFKQKLLLLIPSQRIDINIIEVDEGRNEMGLEIEFVYPKQKIDKSLCQKILNYCRANLSFYKDIYRVTITYYDGRTRIAW